MFCWGIPVNSAKKFETRENTAFSDSSTELDDYRSLYRGSMNEWLSTNVGEPFHRDDERSNLGEYRLKDYRTNRNSNISMVASFFLFSFFLLFSFSSQCNSSIEFYINRNIHSIALNMKNQVHRKWRSQRKKIRKFYQTRNTFSPLWRHQILLKWSITHVVSIDVSFYLDSVPNFVLIYIRKLLILVSSWECTRISFVLKNGFFYFSICCAFAQFFQFHSFSFIYRSSNFLFMLTQVLAFEFCFYGVFILYQSL